MPLIEELDSARLRVRYQVPIGWNGNKCPCIPQQDPHPNRRAFELSIIRTLYSYLPQDVRVNPLTPIAIAGRFPFYEEYGPRWALPYLPQLLRSVVNTELKKVIFSFKKGYEKVKAFKELFSDF